MPTLVRLSSIIGQHRAISHLTSALESGRLHHAWLFAGPPGVGKETTAKAFAAALLCKEALLSQEALLGTEAEGRADACGSCSSCEKVARGVHPDLILLMPEAEAVARKLLAREDLPRAPSRELKIEQIRSMESRLVRAPLEGPRQVVLLLQADSLNVAAQNAFLKTLEEPPAGTHILLVADTGDALLPTIRSRCVRLPFVPLALDLVAEKVREARGVDQETASLCAALSGGSLGGALAISTEALADRGQILAAVEGLHREDLRPLLALAETLGGGGRDECELRLDVLALFYRDVAFAAEGIAGDRLANRDLPGLIERAASRGSEDALRRYQVIGKAREALRRHAAARATLEQMLISFLMPEVQ